MSMGSRIRSFAFAAALAGAAVWGSVPALADSTAAAPVAAPAPSGATSAQPAVTPPAPAAATPAAQAAQASVDLDEIVCKAEDPPTGTRLGARRVCQTQREWNEQRDRERQAIMNAQSKDRVLNGN